MRVKRISENPVHMREDESQFVIRYRVDNDRFAQVLSSVTSRSVALVGVPWQEVRAPGDTKLGYSLIGMMTLTASVDPEQTTATLAGNDLVLRLVKSRLPSRDHVAPSHPHEWLERRGDDISTQNEPANRVKPSELLT
jgi:hypothetical protein